jgi:prephenate dehydratase
MAKALKPKVGKPKVGKPNPSGAKSARSGAGKIFRSRAGKIAFQGVLGAYSHLACTGAYKEMQALPCQTFDDCFAAVATGKADLAMIPIENSVAGRVADIHHLLPESGLYIVAEHFQRVRHYLLAPRGAKLSGVKRVYSHVQALSQCRRIIRDLKLEAVARADTAGAAKEIALRGDVGDCAIASELAGKIYNLVVLRDRIEDAVGNTTRFVVMSRHRQDPDPKSGPCLTSFVFQVRSIPAALYKALGGFATNGVNLAKLESYVADNSFQVAQFYAEVEGHPADPAVDRAFEELKFFSSRFKVLGVFPAADFRRRPR